MANPANIVSLLTPAGTGALALVRIAGPLTNAFLAANFSRPALLHRCVHGQLRDGETTIDDPVIVLGEGWADISLHGGQWVVQRTLELAMRFGFQLDKATATVDSEDAIERDVLNAISSARTELALRVLLSQHNAWATVRETLDVHRLRTALEDRALENLLRLPRVAIVGAPNVGKSTLANALFGSARSITADMPGTTRDWVGEIADINGLAVMLLDTPGVRETSDTIEHRAIELAATESRTADLVVVVLDASQPLAGQRTLFVQYPHAILVLNKSDLPCEWESEVMVTVRTIAHAGDGVPELRQHVAHYFDCDEIDFSQARCWTARQRSIVTAAVSSPPTLHQLWQRSENANS